MAQQHINTGSQPNDHTGDPDRTAFLKVEANFTELYNRAPDGLSGLLAADATTHNYRVAVIGDISFAGMANGLATLGSDGKLLWSQLPSSITGDLAYQGTWNASTNTPALASGVGTSGHFYVVSTAGATALDGISTWEVGDKAVFDGTTNKWERVATADNVVSVAGKTGVVSLVVGDISGAAPLASPTFTGTPAAPTPGSNVNTTQIPTCAWVNNYYAPLASPALTGSPTAPTQAANDNSTKVATTAYADRAVGTLSQHGKCILVFQDSSHVLLKPRDGNKLIIGGVQQTIPSSGVSGAVTGLTVSTLYYVYAYMNAGTMTLEFSTTIHGTDASTGVEVKSGDSTRTIVGMVYPITGPAFVDSMTQRLVRSWFNDNGAQILTPSPSNATTSGTSAASAGTTFQAEFLNWAGECCSFSLGGLVANNTSTQNSLVQIGINGTAVGSITESYANTANTYSACACAAGATLSTEAHNTVVPFIWVTAGTGTYNFAISGNTCRHG